MVYNKNLLAGNSLGKATCQTSRTAGLCDVKASAGPVPSDMYIALIDQS